MTKGLFFYHVTVNDDGIEGFIKKYSVRLGGVWGLITEIFFSKTDSSLLLDS